MNKIKINKITIDNVNYNVVDGGTNCKNCVVQKLCINQGFAHGVSFDCTSVHLVKDDDAKEDITLPNPPDSVELSDEVLHTLYGGGEVNS